MQIAEVERFLVEEARLLDEGRYESWLDLFTADAWYWVPLARDQASPFDTISLMYDDRRLLETRVRRLGNPNIHAQLPASRTSRIVANVTIEESEPAADATVVRSKLMMLESRADKQRMFGGTCRHRLVRADGGIRIAWKRVDLINSEGVLDGLVVPF
ncbi:MAG: ring hydroxylating subunit beta family protein 1 [Rhodospirillales bacterium]|nr:ring hydroxylating subunit beta family protein 1 [Rhodospirillales bacterium]